MHLRILSVFCALPILGAAQGIPYSGLRTLEDLLQQLRATGFVEAHLLITHADPKDTRQFHVFLETPNQRSEIDIGKDGSLRLPELAKEDAEHAFLKSSLERGALNLSFDFGFGGTVPFEHPEGRTLFELCAPAAEKLGQFNHVWRDIAEAFHQPEINSVQFGIVGFIFTRQKPSSGRLLLMHGQKTVDSIDLSQPGTNYWLFEEYDPKTHRMVWERGHHGKFPEMHWVIMEGKELDSYRGAIFLKKGEQTGTAKVSQRRQEEANDLTDRAVNTLKNLRLITRETSLGKIPFMADMKQMALSRDNRHVAFPVMRGGRWTVWRDGVEGKPYRAVRNLSFSPNGKRLAYVGVRGGQWENQEGPIEKEGRFPLSLSLRDADWMMVVDGKEGPPFEGIYDFDSPFSPDSQRVGYRALRRGGSNACVVVDGKEGPALDDIPNLLPIFSPDSKRFAYVATNAGKWLVVVDGKKGQQYDNVYVSLCFSPDSQHVAYMAKRDGKRTVVVDGKEEPTLNPVGRVVFSPDSSHIAFVAEHGTGQWCVVEDGKEGKEYQGIGGLVFSPDSHKLAFAAYLKPDAKGGTVVVNGKEGPVFDRIGHDSITFSPDSQRLAYAVLRRGKWVVVVDGKEGQEFMSPGAGPLVFSPDSQRLAYTVPRDGKWLVVVDGQEGIGYDGIGKRFPVFSPDGHHVVYPATRGNKQLIVVDGKESPEYDAVWPPAFDGPNRIRAVADRLDNAFKDELLRVEIKILEE